MSTVFDEFNFGFNADKAIRDFFRPAPMPKELHMRTDISDRKDAYVISVDVPGFKKEEVSVKLDGEYLCVEAKHEVAEDAEEPKYLRHERRSASCRREFRIGSDFTADDISAVHEDGVLTITLKKKAEDPKPEAVTIDVK